MELQNEIILLVQAQREHLYRTQEIGEELGTMNGTVSERLDFLTTEVQALGAHVDSMHAQGVSLSRDVNEWSEQTAELWASLPNSFTNLEQRMSAMERRQEFLESSLTTVSDNVQLIGDTMKELLDQFLAIRDALENTG